jgi:hypothetical protein
MRRPHHPADHRVQSRTIPATGQHPDPLDFCTLHTAEISSFDAKKKSQSRPSIEEDDRRCFCAADTVQKPSPD